MKRLSTEVIHRLCATPKTALITLLNLTGLVRCHRLKRAAGADSSQGRMQLMGAVYVLAAITSITSIPVANSANYSIDHLKLYAHSRILDYKEFQCFNRIITKESRWSYTARNGSHRGLGQMRSEHYGNLDPYRQIDATLRYVSKRYGTNCKAWAFHQERNYY
jgi:hypothetical protein